MREWLRSLFAGRPWWMNGLMLFCFFMSFIYVPWDLLLKPLEKDVDVWFGIMFTGWQAKVSAAASTESTPTAPIVASSRIAPIRTVDMARKPITVVRPEIAIGRVTRAIAAAIAAGSCRVRAAVSTCMT